jgi:hypothetical protein
MDGVLDRAGSRAWAALGFLYLLYLTRRFRHKPPAMHTGGEPDPVSAR